MAAPVPAGTDLTAVTTQAADGATITLGPGDYPGQIVVKGKSLTIKGDPGGKTVLDGSGVQAIVVVLEKGHLTLGDVTFKTRAKDGLAVYVKGASASVSNGRARATVQPAFYVENGSLDVVGCRFDETAGDGILGVKGAKVTVRDSEFSGIKGYGVTVQGQSRAEIKGSRFRGVEKAGVLAAGGATAVVQDSQFSEISGDGVVAEDSEGEIAGSSFEAVGGIAVLGVENARVSVAGSRFKGIKATAVQGQGGAKVTVANSTFADVDGDAVVAADAGSLTVRDSVFERTKGAAVLIEGKGALAVQGSKFTDVRVAVAAVKSNAEVTVSRNIVAGTADEQTAIWLSTSGKTVVSGNLVFDAYDGIGLAGTLESTAEVTGNAVVNARATALYMEAQLGADGGPVRIAGNHIVNAAKLGVLLQNTPNVAVSGNLILSRGEYGLLVQKGSSASLSRNVVIAQKTAVYFHESAGEGSALGDDVVVAGTPAAVVPAAGPHRTPESLKMGAMLSDSEVAERPYGMAAAAMDAAKGATAAGFAGLQAAYAPLLQEAARLREQMAAMSVVTLETVDAVGRPFAAEFALLDFDGEIISEHDAANPIAVVSPGAYVVEPSFDPALAQEVTVEAGETKVVRVTARDYLAVLFQGYDWDTDSATKTRLPLRFKDRAAMRRVLAGSPPATKAARRPGATKEQLDQALRLARERLPAVFELGRAAEEQFNTELRNFRGDPAGVDKLEQKTGRGTNPFIWAVRIMAIAGDESDAKRLIDMAAKEEDAYYRDALIKTAARIENRLGMLERGAVASLLKSEDPGVAFAVAEILHGYGLSQGDAILLARLGDPKDDQFTYGAAASLLDTDTPAVLDGMRSVVAKTMSERARVEAEHEGKEGAPNYPYSLQNAGQRAAIYLLAYGDESDWKLVSGFPFAEDSMLRLAKLVRDPRPFVDFKLGLTGGGSIRYDPKEVAKFCPALRLLPPRVADEMDRSFEDALVGVAINLGVSEFGARQSAMHANWKYSIAKSYCRASRIVAQLVFMKSSKWLKNTPWLPKTWEQDGLVAEFAAGNSLVEDQLSYAPHAKLVEALGGGKAGDNVPHADLFLAYHLIGTGACKPNTCAFAVINSDNPAGALGGVVGVRSEFLEERLRIGLSFDLAAHTEGGFLSQMDPPTRSFQNYLATRGKALVSKAYLKRGDKVIELADAGADSRGDLVYEASLDEPDLSDLYLHVELQILDQTWPLDFAVFAGRDAKRYHMGLARAARAEKVAKANADDVSAWVAWGDALQDIGRLTAAKEKYAKALALRPDDLALWFATSDMFSSRKLHGEAREVMKEAAAANPQSADVLVELANLSYRGGAYGEAAEAYGKLSAVEPDDARWRWWQAANWFLAGAFGEASDFFRSAPNGYQASRTAILRYLSALRAGSEDADPAEAELKALYEAAKETAEGRVYGVLSNAVSPEQAFEVAKSDVEQCRANLHVGFRFLLSGEQALARKRFSAALDGCRANQLEHRMAMVELERLGPAE